MSSNPNLHNEALAARSLMQAMQSEQDGYAEEDAELVVASETNLLEAIEAALLANAQDAAHIETLKGVIATMEARKERKVARIERRKGAIMAALEIVGLSKLELATGTVSVGKGQPKVIVTDEAAIPAEYLRHPAPKPDLTSIKLALRDGREVPGALLSNAAPVLTVRTK